MSHSGRAEIHHTLFPPGTRGVFPQKEKEGDFMSFTLTQPLAVAHPAWGHWDHLEERRLLESCPGLGLD